MRCYIMSIILTTLNSKYIHTNLAIRYLKANAPEFDITLREYTLKDTLENILEDLLSRKPKIIGFSVYIWNVEKTLQLIKLLKEKDPTLTIFMGGPEVSYDFDVWFSRSPIDYIIYGEGELSFKELMEALHMSLCKTQLHQFLIRKKYYHHFILKKISHTYQIVFNILKRLVDVLTHVNIV